jgi:hypothetical protein
MPLWISIPVVSALWLSSWISGLDPTGDLADTYVIWTATVMATGLLALRLLRSA